MWYNSCGFCGQHQCVGACISCATENLWQELVLWMCCGAVGTIILMLNLWGIEPWSTVWKARCFDFSYGHHLQWCVLGHDMFTLLLVAGSVEPNTERKIDQAYVTGDDFHTCGLFNNGPWLNSLASLTSNN